MPGNILADVIQGIGYFIIIAPFIILLLGMFLDSVGEGIYYLFEGLIGQTTFIIMVVSAVIVGVLLIVVGKIIKSRSEY